MEFQIIYKNKLFQHFRNEDSNFNKEKLEIEGSVKAKNFIIRILYEELDASKKEIKHLKSEFAILKSTGKFDPNNQEQLIKSKGEIEESSENKIHENVLREKDEKGDIFS